MRGGSNTGAKAVRSQGRSPSPWLWPVLGEEADPVVHLGVQSTFATLREVYLAPWAAGERVSLAMGMPAMLEEAGESDSPSFEKRKKKKKPFTLPFSLGLRRQIGN